MSGGRVGCATLALSISSLAVAGAARDPLATLRAGHPRLLVEPDAWARLRERRRADERLDRLLQLDQANARRILTEPPAEHRKIGRRLLSVSRSVLERTLTLALAFRVTGDAAFAQRAELELLAAADFPDWNPSHFLDVAEMTAALAFGYDWLHDVLTPEARATIRAAIAEKGLRPGLHPKAPHNGWQTRENNWNQVCFGGLTLGALAIAEDEPELSRQVLARARAGIVHGLAPYAPDGVYPEGPGYWSYGTTYQVLMIAALQTALGDDWGLPKTPGFLESAGALLQQIGPSGLPFNFSDGREQIFWEPALYWFARQQRDPGLLQMQSRQRDEILGGGARNARPTGEARRFLPLAAIWWPEKESPAAPRLALRWTGRGVTPIAVFRGSWTDPRSLYLALKGGSASANHAHMDAGSFVLERDGVRWARDLGMQEYESLESQGVDLWNMRQDSQRWQVFRLNSESHNTLTIDGRAHRVLGAARMVAFSDAAAAALAIVDLSPVFAGQAGSVRRGFRVLGDRSVLIQDELAGLTPGAVVRWAMVTGAEITIQGSQARLDEAGETLTATLLDGSARFVVRSAEPTGPAWNAPNLARRILTTSGVAGRDGKLRVAVLLGDAAVAAPLVPLDAWQR